MISSAGSLRVLMFVPQYPYPVVGGLEKQSHELSKALLAAGFSVQVLSGKVVEGQPEQELVEGVPVRRIDWPAAKWRRFLGGPWKLGRILVAERSRFDVLHIHQHSWVGLFMIALARLLRKPVLTKMPSVGCYGLPGMRRQSFGSLRRWLLFRAHGLVAMSRESHSELLDEGYPADRILAVPNGIALGPRGVREERASDGVRVVFVGRLTVEKRLEVLLQAWAGVCAQETSCKLEIWGEGPLEQDLKRQCQGLDLKERVLFAGQVKDVPVKLSGMDIFVLPSSIEGNSNALLEAMAAGLPIVSTRVGGTPMLVGPEGGPYLCPPGDAPALEAALLGLIRDSGRRTSQGAAMRARVERYFDIRVVAGTYAEAYALLRSGKPELDRLSSPVVLEG